jgi:hypothetical protein
VSEVGFWHKADNRGTATIWSLSEQSGHHYRGDDRIVAPFFLGGGKTWWNAMWLALRPDALAR